MNWRRIAWIAGVGAVTTGTLFAYVLQSGPKWPDGNVTVRLQLGNSPTYSDGTNPDSTGVAALEHWNQYIGRVQLVANLGSAADKGAGDRVNDVFFSPNIYGQSFPPDVLAVALSSSNSTQRTECDIIVNPLWVWDAYRGPLKSDGKIDLRRVLIHELGHFLGLGHPDAAGQYVNAIMNAYISNLDGTALDDQDGAVSLYGRGVANAAVPPTIPGYEPGDLIVDSGERTTFYVNATGTAPLTYQWLKDGVAVPGANTYSFEIPQTRTADAGLYAVRVTNEAASVTSRAAQLTVNPPVAPSIPSSMPSDVVTTEGARFTFYITYGGTRPQTFQWRKNGVDIPGATSAAFGFAAPLLSDAGRYSVRVTNEVGSVTSREALLTVNAGQPPTIVTQPHRQEADVGSTVSLNVSATSNIAMSYQWFRDGVAVPGATSSTLQLSSVTFAAEGTYTVAISTAAGSATSIPARLSVYPAPLPPILTTVAASSSVVAGQYINLGVMNFTGFYSYQWFRNGQVLPGQFSSSLFISTSKEADEGAYHVVATNGTGSTASVETYVTVAPASAPPGRWISTQRDGAIVYFLFGNPARIERFDLPTDAFLSPINLPRTPTAMTVLGGEIFVAFGTAVSRFPLGGGTESPVGTAPGPVFSLTGTGGYLYGLADATSYSKVFSLAVGTGAVVQSSSSYRMAPTLVVDATHQRVAMRTASPPGIVAARGIAADGSFVPGAQSEISDGGSATGRLFLSPDQGRLVSQVGFVYRASDLAFLDSVGRDFSDGVFLPDGSFLALRDNRVTAYSPAIAEMGQLTLATAGDALAADETSLVVFTVPGAAGAPIQRQRVPLSQLVPMPDPSAVDPTTLQFEPDGIWNAADGTVLLSCRAQRNVFRWSIAQQRYLDSIPLGDVPDRVEYFRNYHQLFEVYSTREIRTLSLADAGAAEEHVGAVVGSLLDLAVAGEHLMVVDRRASDLNFQFLNLDGTQAANESWWAYFSTCYTWNAAKRRMYFLNDGSSARELVYVQLQTDGTISARGRMNPYTTALENLRPPVFIAPVGDLVLLGSGHFFDADTFAEKSFALANRCDDAAWQGTTLFTGRNLSTGTEIQRWSGTLYLLDRSRLLPGRLLRLFAINDTQLLVITSVDGRVQFTVLDRELSVQNHVVGSGTEGGRLINLSTRAEVGTDDKVMIAGFVVSGSAPKSVLVRGIGPTLASFNVTGVLADPVLEIFNASSQSIGTNDNWEVGNPADISQIFAAVNAFPLPAGSADAAIVLTLAPGNYTAQVSGKNRTTGVALVEAYDLETTVEAHRLVNMSTRAVVGSGANVLIPGLVIQGTNPKRLLLRAVGPSLALVGLPPATLLSDPELEVINEQGRVVAANDDWGQGNPANVTAAGSVTFAFPLADGSQDAAVVVTLPPGLYTVLVRGAGSSTGVALVEAYEIP